MAFFSFKFTTPTTFILSWDILFTMTKATLIKNAYLCPYIESRVDVIIKDKQYICCRRRDWNTGVDCRWRGMEFCVEILPVK